MIKKPKIIILEHDGCSLIYDSRNTKKPFNINGNIKTPNILRGIIFAMERELYTEGVNLRDPKQMSLLKWKYK